MNEWVNELALKATLEYFLSDKHVDTWAVTWLVAVPHVIPRVVISLRRQSMTLLLTLSALMALMYSQESRFSMVCKKTWSITVVLELYYLRKMTHFWQRHGIKSSNIPGSYLWLSISETSNTAHRGKKAGPTPVGMCLLPQKAVSRDSTLKCLSLTLIYVN